MDTMEEEILSHHPHFPLCILLRQTNSTLKFSLNQGRPFFCRPEESSTHQTRDSGSGESKQHQHLLSCQFNPSSSLLAYFRTVTSQILGFYLHWTVIRTPKFPRVNEIVWNPPKASGWPPVSRSLSHQAPELLCSRLCLCFMCSRGS